ncbi:HTH_Tnp_Tc3_2 domain-containing protein [Trichonephila clavipes]|nr:HTH_Tnp_Tc3_2 domain-containing protein [Trichonephila clavipes]
MDPVEGMRGREAGNTVWRITVGGSHSYPSARRNNSLASTQHFLMWIWAQGQLKPNFSHPKWYDLLVWKDSGRQRDCGLSFREIGSRVGRNQTTVIRICDRWIQDGTRDRRGRSHPPQCTTSREDRQSVRMAVTDRSVTSRTVAQNIESVTHHSVSARTI